MRYSQHSDCPPFLLHRNFGCFKKLFGPVGGVYIFFNYQRPALADNLAIPFFVLLRNFGGHPQAVNVPFPDYVLFTDIKVVFKCFVASYKTRIQIFAEYQIGSRVKRGGNGRALNHQLVCAFLYQRFKLFPLAAFSLKHNNQKNEYAKKQGLHAD